MFAIRLTAGVALAFAFSTIATAQEHATLDEAQAMAEAAAAYLEAESPEVAFDAFTNSPEWKDRDLYVFVVDGDGMVWAHGEDPTEVGLDRFELTDVNGVPFIQAFIAVETAGWVDYVWLDPVTGLEEPKTSYVIRVGDYVVGVGAYRPDGG